MYLDRPRLIRYHGLWRLHAHCVADSLDELHRTMRAINVPPFAFHNKPRLPHYDLFNEGIRKALHHGAQVLERHPFMERAYHMAAQAPLGSRWPAARLGRCALAQPSGLPPRPAQALAADEEAAQPT